MLHALCNITPLDGAAVCFYVVGVNVLMCMKAGWAGGGCVSPQEETPPICALKHQHMDVIPMQNNTVHTVLHA